MADPYARVSLSLLNWAPFLACSERAQLAWMKMYVSSAMKSACTGLFPGSLNLFAEVTRLAFGDAVETLGELVEKKMVEHDPTHRLIRYLRLPDRADRPDNGACLIRWWKGFEILPVCPTRDRHVSLIRWLCGEPFSKDHQKAWDTSFGTLCLTDDVSDTSETTPQVADPSSNQRNLFDNHDIRDHGGVVPGDHQYRYRLRSRLRSEGEHERETAPLAEGTSPNLRPLTLTAVSMLNAIAGAAGGRVSFDLVDRRLLPDLESVAEQASLAGVTLADLDLAGRFLQAGALAYRKDLGASWAARPGNVLELVASARQWQKGDLRLDPKRAQADEDETREPAPPSAFKTGIRAL